MILYFLKIYNITIILLPFIFIFFITIYHFWRYYKMSKVIFHTECYPKSTNFFLINLLYIYPTQVAFKSFYYKFHNEIPNITTIFILFLRSIFIYIIGIPYLILKIIYYLIIFKKLSIVWKKISPELDISLHFRNGVIYRNMGGKPYNITLSNYKPTNVILPNDVECGMIKSITPSGKTQVHFAGRDRYSNTGYQLTNHPNKIFKDSIVELNDSSIVVQEYKYPLEYAYTEITNKQISIISQENKRLLIFSLDHRINSQIEIRNEIYNGMYQQYVYKRNINENYEALKTKYNITRENIVQEHTNYEININVLKRIDYDNNFLDYNHGEYMDKNLLGELQHKRDFYYNAHEQIDDPHIKKSIEAILLKFGLIL